MVRPETWEQVYLFALGELQLRPKQFWRLSWREYLALCAGQELRQVRAWHHTRFLSALLININRAALAPVVTVEEVLPLPGDGPRRFSGMSLDELEATLARLNEF